jgi:tRNA threonylcarbamoyladenosine biosynthesis protein TsaE
MAAFLLSPLAALPRLPTRLAAARTVCASFPIRTSRARRISLPSAACTARLGHLLARDARAGDVLCLLGDLGAGKTSFARGYVRAARRDAALDVTSPTYCLDNAYPPSRDERALPSAAPLIHHMDLWRLRSASERSFVDFDVVFADHIALIEWPDRLGALTPADRLDVRIEFVPRSAAADDEWGFEDDGAECEGRVATLVPHGASWCERLAALKVDFI